jgi:hypothetical protein
LEKKVVDRDGGHDPQGKTKIRHLTHTAMNLGPDPNGTKLRGILEVVYMSPLQGFVL